MEPQKTNNELIEKFLEGKLKGDELDRFTKRMESDPAFKLEVNTTRLLIEGIRIARREELRRYIADNADTRYTVNLWGKNWMFAAAAIVVFFVGLLVVLELYLPEKQQILAEGEIPKEQKQEITASDEPAVEEKEMSAGETKSPLTKEIKPLKPLPPEVLDMAEDAREFAAGQSMEESEFLPDEKIVVQQDKKTGDTLLQVFALATYSKEAEPAIELKKSRAPLAGQSKADQEKDKEAVKPQKSEVKSSAAKGEMVSETEPAVINERVMVEFWKSPVNFRGYQFDGRKLLLFGIQKGANIRIVFHEKSYYLRINNEHYHLKQGAEFNPYQKITDTALIKILSGEN